MVVERFNLVSTKFFGACCYCERKVIDGDGTDRT